MSDRRVFVQLPAGQAWCASVRQATTWAVAHQKSWIGVYVGHELLILQCHDGQWVLADVRPALARDPDEDYGHFMFMFGFFGGALGAWLSSTRAALIVGVIGLVWSVWRGSRRRQRV